jgi:hypothetical protein
MLPNMLRLCLKVDECKPLPPGGSERSSFEDFARGDFLGVAAPVEFESNFEAKL